MLKRNPFSPLEQIKKLQLNETLFNEVHLSMAVKIAILSLAKQSESQKDSFVFFSFSIDNIIALISALQCNRFHRFQNIWASTSGRWKWPMGDGIISAVVMMLVTIKMAKILIEIVIHKHLRLREAISGLQWLCRANGFKNEKAHLTDGMVAFQKINLNLMRNPEFQKHLISTFS